MKFIVSIACNDHRNGMFSGRAYGLSFDKIDAYLDDFDVRFSELKSAPGGTKRFRFGRRIFEYDYCKEYLGNWCWNGYRMEADEALKLLEYARTINASLVEAPEELFSAWQHGESLGGLFWELVKA